MNKCKILSVEPMNEKKKLLYSLNELDYIKLNSFPIYIDFKILMI